MEQTIIIENKKVYQTLVEFLKSLDIKIISKPDNGYELLKNMEREISASFNDLKKGNISSWKGKKITLKNG